MKSLKNLYTLVEKRIQLKDIIVKKSLMEFEIDFEKES